MAGPTIIVGGHSRAGRAVRAEMKGAEMISVVRGDPVSGEIATSDYTNVPSSLNLAGATIVNCVGSPLGDADTLMRLNRDVPCAWAEAGRAAGARGMVQISSFSIFGPVQKVDRATPTLPTSDYGRSKLAAETMLAEISSGDFPIALLRVPILVGGGPDKLSQLVTLARRTGFVPAANHPTPRSMLPYAGLARAIRLAIEQRLDGPLAAADPEPFTPALLQEEARKLGKKVRKFTLPAPATALVRRIAPGIHASLLAPNVLSPDANLLAGETDYERLRDVVSRLLAA